MRDILVLLRRILRTPLSFILVAANLGVDIWSHFLKPNVPGFRYDYHEEPTYFKIFRTLNVVPESIAGLIFYPIDRLFLFGQDSYWQVISFSAIFALLCAIQWALVGYFIVFLWRSMIGERRD
ncbi:MAG: hypothetical protein WBD22_02815 [Pyrinomonadaceae bacterium]